TFECSNSNQGCPGAAWPRSSSFFGGITAWLKVLFALGDSNLGVRPTSGNRRVKGTHIGVQKGPTGVQEYTSLTGLPWPVREAALVRHESFRYLAVARRNGGGLCGDATHQGIAWPTAYHQVLDCAGPTM